MTKAIEIPGDDNVEYGWSLARDAEIFNGTVTGLVRTILTAFASYEGAGIPDAVFVGRREEVQIDADDLVETMEARAADVIGEQCGDAADGFGFDPEERPKLVAAIEALLARHDFGCFIIGDIKRYDGAAPEYQRAVNILAQTKSVRVMTSAEETACRAAYENRFHKIRATIGYDDWREIWSPEVVR